MAIRSSSSSQELSWALPHNAAPQPHAPVLSSTGCQWGESWERGTYSSLYFMHEKQFILHAWEAFCILLCVSLGIFRQHKNIRCKVLHTIPWPPAASPARIVCAPWSDVATTAGALPVSVFWYILLLEWCKELQVPFLHVFVQICFT